MMTISVYFEEDSPVRLWGLTPRQRLVKSLAPLPDVVLADDTPASRPGTAQPGTEILVLRADYVYDQRVLNGLLDSEAGQLALTDPGDDSVVAVRARADQWPRDARPSLANAPLSSLQRMTPATVASGAHQSKLRKFDTPWVARVSAPARRRLENALFSAAYKGVTDLVTKWAWPLPARAVTRLCVRWGLRPNHVTSLSYVLAIVAGVLFGYGEFGAGLLAGWIMTFLDTVDGKLARVTLTSSRFGNIFDHALDLIHPPLWYIAWGAGLGVTADVTGLLWLIVIGYIGGRLCEGAFKFAAPFSMFIWRPFDSVNRLVTARRNPNLILLTLAWGAGSPHVGLVLVTLWTLLSTLVLAVRLGQGLLARVRGEPPRAWLHSDDPRAGRHPLMVRWFTFPDPAIRSGR